LNLPCVVHPVGEQNHDFAFRGRILQPSQGYGQTVANCRPVFHDALPRVLDLVERFKEEFVIVGERALGVTFGSEDDQAQPVATSLLLQQFNKVPDDPPRCFHAVGQKVRSSHAARDVQSDYDVNAFRSDFLPSDKLRAGNGDEQRNDAKPPKSLREILPPIPDALAEKLDVRVREGCRLTPPDNRNPNRSNYESKPNLSEGQTHHPENTEQNGSVAKPKASISR
jgi:hypothetical protein